MLNLNSEVYQTFSCPKPKDKTQISRKLFPGESVGHSTMLLDTPSCVFGCQKRQASLLHVDPANMIQVRKTDQ